MSQTSGIALLPWTSRMPADISQLRLTTRRTSEMDNAARDSVVQLCLDAHGLDDFRNLLTYLPGDGLHFLAHVASDLVGHAVVTTRWLQAGDGPLLRTAYVDAVSVAPARQALGLGRTVMSHLASTISDFDIACLETDKPGFYETLGWQRWRGPLSGRREDGSLVPTPGQEGIMVLRLPHTPALSLDSSLSVEITAFRTW